jgi:NAD(P)-dependent dehydrogenase (short-subunit alcohol dehydrogenase family)
MPRLLAVSIPNLPSPEELELARSEIEDLGVGVVARGLDVRSEASAREFFGQAVRAFGSIDILVNAAGVCAH